VFEDDREVEFHDFLDFCKAEFMGGQLAGFSCEHLARGLGTKITRAYVGRRVMVSVFEDNEVGARVTLESPLTPRESAPTRSQEPPYGD